MRILLADDDEGTRELVKRALQTDGHNVEAVGDGTAAADKVATGTYDAVIADIDMPGLDGIAVAQKARQASPAIAVVLISAHQSELARSSEVASGKVEVLVKPFSLDAIRAAIAKVS